MASVGRVLNPSGTELALEDAEDEEERQLGRRNTGREDGHQKDQLYFAGDVMDAGGNVIRHEHTSPPRRQGRQRQRRGRG